MFDQKTKVEPRVKSQKPQARGKAPLLVAQENLGIQAKADSHRLQIGNTNDAFEIEADAMAAYVTSSPLSNTNFESPTSFRPESKVNRRQRPQIQRKGATNKSQNGKSAPIALQKQLETTKGAGASLDKSIAGAMGSAMGSDFGNVRIHTSAKAAEMSQSIQARAFTHGNDIYFNRGEFNPTSAAGKHLLAHELTHVVQQTGMLQRAPTPAAGPMTRADFETKMRNDFGVFIIKTGTLADQRKEMGITKRPEVVLPNWTSWDPGAASETYQHIVDSFEQFNTTFSGFPTVNSITFYNMYYELSGNTATASSGVGASFGARDMNIYAATTSANKGLPMARSNATGTYQNKPIATLGYGGDPNAAPVGLPTRKQTAMRIILHELGHGLAVAAQSANYNGTNAAIDPNLMKDYQAAAGWANPGALYDIGVAAVATDLAAKKAPDAQYQITAANWNDPKWVEQPVSDYMVSGGPGEDFAEAVMTYIENKALLQARSPKRAAFLDARKTVIQPRLQQKGPRSLMPKLPPTLFPANPTPNFMLPPLMVPTSSDIDWGAMRSEIILRGAPYDASMQDSIQSTWMQSHRFYTDVLGLSSDTATTWTNRTMPSLIGSALSNDYPTMIEQSDRDLDTSTIGIPVSEIIRGLLQ